MAYIVNAASPGPRGAMGSSLRLAKLQPVAISLDIAALASPAVDQTSSERTRIEAALAQSNGKISGAHGAAAKLGMPPSTLESRIRSLKINKFQFKGV
jgi:transcriptional regulator with GAF, ATPase, and Fis domain